LQGCGYNQCNNCAVCCTTCRDRFSSCPGWVSAYGCTAHLTVNGEHGALSGFCKKSCKTCK
jgi:hypothetical protein